MQTKAWLPNKEAQAAQRKQKPKPVRWSPRKKQSEPRRQRPEELPAAGGDEPGSSLLPPTGADSAPGTASITEPNTGDHGSEGPRSTLAAGAAVLSGVSQTGAAAGKIHSPTQSYATVAARAVDIAKREDAMLRAAIVASLEHSFSLEVAEEKVAPVRQPPPPLPPAANQPTPKSTMSRENETVRRDHRAPRTKRP